MYYINLLILSTVLLSLNLCYGQPQIKSFSRNIHGNLTNPMIGSAVQLNCETTDNTSLIQIKRSHDEKVLVESREKRSSISYQIMSAKCDDSGIYQCIINNKQSQTVGGILSDCPPLPCQASDVNMTLFVDDSETVNFILCVLTYEELFKDIVINNSTIRMNASATPSNWTWYYQENKSTAQFVTNVSVIVTKSSVTIEDYGNVKVTVSTKYNVFFHLNYNILLRPRGPPVCLTELTVTDQGFDNILLSWQIETDKGQVVQFCVHFSKDNLTWFTYDVPSGQKTANITGLLDNTNYYFKVESLNKFRKNGNMSCSENTIVGKTSRNVLGGNIDKVTVSTYLPPLIILVGSIIFTVVLCIKKKKCQ